MTLSKDTSMLGRGVKRKWSCLEELEADVGSDATVMEQEAAEEGGGPGPSVSRLQQRQLVLGLCLEKLQRYQAGVELSLRRSVLLINTLRQIQEEMRSDGVVSGPPDVLLGGVRPDSCLFRDDFREDVSVTCPGCVEGDVASSSPSQSPEASSQEVAPSPDQQRPSLATFSDAVSAMGYLGDLALDDIFEDIDTSMYETSDLPSAWAAGSLWPVSVSLWPDEDVKLRGPPAGGLQSCLTDLNELDHIMEILVKS